MRVLVGLKLLGHLGQRGRLQHVDDEHAVVGGQRPTALGDDVGVWDAVLVRCLHEGVDTVVHILLYRVVHRTLAAGGAGAVVVNAQSTTAVDEVHVVAHLVQLHIELRGLAQGGLYATYLRYLAADVEVNESQTIAHILAVKQLQRFQQLGTGEAKFRGIAAALLPLAGAAAGQFDAYADVGTHVELLGHTGDDVELVQLLHHDEYLLAHLLCQQRQLDVALVFVTVAHDDTVALALHGDDGVQFGLRTRFNTQVELAAVRDNFLHHGLHLVHLDGIHHIVLSLVVILLGGFLEAAPRLLDTVVEDVGEAQQHRCRHVAQLQLVHHLAQVNLRGVLAGSDIHVASVVDAEVVCAPAADVVQLAGVVDGPFLHFRCGI